MDIIDEMVEIIEQPGNKIIEQEIQLFNTKIKEYAEAYLKIIRRDQEELIKYEKILKHEKEIVTEIQKASMESTYEWRTQIKNRKWMLQRDFYRQMVTASLNFQNQLNELLNQVVELVYVYQDKHGNPSLYTLDQKSLSAALTYQKNKQTIAGRFRENKNFSPYLIDQNLTKYELFEGFNLDFFNYTYKEVIWRFNYGHKKKTDLIMWLNPSSKPKWLKVMINTTGDIKQAYASVILDRKINEIKLFNDQKLDNNIHNFMQEIAKVDNQSGLFKGDVTVKNIQYAIKGIDAQTLGMSQIISIVL